MQVFRLMGMPDRIIAFDELPEDLVKDIELHDESRLPRYWREFIGLRERTIKMRPYLDTMLNKVVQAPPLLEKKPFTYLIDKSINKDKEQWEMICNYIRRNAPSDFRLLDKIEDMAAPMAADTHSELTLEPEQVPVIPLNKAAVKEAVPRDEFAPVLAKDEHPMELCSDCGREFESKRALRMHRMKRHKAVAA